MLPNVALTGARRFWRVPLECKVRPDKQHNATTIDLTPRVLHYIIGYDHFILFTFPEPSRNIST
jgi:hypothetical protein